MGRGWGGIITLFSSVERAGEEDPSTPHRPPFLCGRCLQGGRACSVSVGAVSSADWGRGHRPSDPPSPFSSGDKALVLGSTAGRGGKARTWP